MEIYSGTAKFTTPRPFEKESAEVLLSYTLTPGEDAEAIGDIVGQMAKRQALKMIGVAVNPTLVPTTAPAVAPQNGHAVAPAVLPPTSVAVPEVAAVKPVVVIGEPKLNLPGQPIGDAMGLGVPANPTPAASVPSVLEAPLVGTSGANASATSTTTISPSEIKDADLHTAAAHAVTRLAPAHGEMASIKVTALIGEFTNPPSMRAIPQERRQEFLTKLDALS